MGSITSLSHHYHHQVHHQQAQQLHASSAEYRMVSKEAEHKQATKHNPNALCCWIDGFQDQQNQNQKEKEDKKENNALEGKAKSHPMEGTPCVNLHDHYVCRASSDVMLYLCDHHFQKHKSFLEHKVLGKDNIDAYSLRPFSRGMCFSFFFLSCFRLKTRLDVVYL